MYSLHPATPLLLWSIFLLTTVGLGRLPLLIGGFVAVTLAFLLAGSAFMRLMRRSRWLLLVTMLTCVWMTPGTRIIPELGVSQEGLALAADNVMRLLAALATLSLLLRWQHENELIGGLHALARPFKKMGLDPDRFAVRLAITLAAVRGNQTESDAHTGQISLPVRPFGYHDVIALIMALASALVALVV